MTEQREQLNHSIKVPESPVPQEETKAVEKPSFFDPLSDSNSSMFQNSMMSKPQDAAKKVEKENHFVAKRIESTPTTPADEEEWIDLDAEPKQEESKAPIRAQNTPKDYAPNTSKPNMHTPADFGRASQPTEEPIVRIKTDFDFEKEDEEISEPPKNLQNQNSNDILGMIHGGITGGLSVIKQKKKEFVDPLVKNGLKNISEKWNE